MKRVAFNVSALDGKFALHLTNSFVVLGLKIARKDVNIADLLDRLPHLTDVDISTIQAAHVSLIFGMDNPMAHEVYVTKVDRRYPRSPRANLTPL